MTSSSDPLSAVADWSWTIDASTRIIELSHSAAVAFGVPPRRLLNRQLGEIGRLGDRAGTLLDNTSIDLPGGRFYLSAIAVGDDGRQSGLATRDPLPPLGGSDRADLSVARRVRPTVSSLADLAERLANDLADGGDRYAGYSSDVILAADHLRSLVDHQRGVGRTVLELDALAVRACGMVLIRAKERGIQLQAPAGTRLRALGDERAALQILANLLTNAIKYTPSGGRVGIDIDRADGFVAAAVWDTGPGISPDDRARIFEEFERLPDADGEGAGLGLGISQRLARAMGGEIRLDSEAGQGTRATLLLPIA